jgi:hypothetical protein
MLRQIAFLTFPIRELSRLHSLSVHELDRIHIQLPRSRIRPFNPIQGFTGDPNSPTGRGNLTFSTWELFHAIKKAELSSYRPRALVLMYALGSWIEHFDLFDPSDELRLRPGASHRYADFSSSSLAGRIAQGVSFLFMNRRGYPYGERLESLISRILTGRDRRPDWGIRGRRFSANIPRGPIRSPDFIFEKAGSEAETALAESKGGFVSPQTSRPDFKGILTDGLEQLSSWHRYLTPSPRKSFVHGTFLREIGDTEIEPSMLAFVDPDGDDTHNGRRSYPEDAIRRANYSGWLREMGFEDSAEALISTSTPVRSRLRRLITKELPVGLESQRFALTVWGIEIDNVITFFDTEVPPNPVEAFESLVREIPKSARLLISAINVDVLKQLSLCLAQPNQSSLREVPAFLDAKSPTDGPVVGSAFTDGTFIGSIDASFFQSADRPETLNIPL